MLSREEVIRAVAFAQPTAKLGEKFQYQNVMFSAAGEAVAKAQSSTWEQVVDSRILKPLGMKATNISIQEMQRAPDFSLGYEYIVTTKQARRLPMRDLKGIAPAGAINSNARDMAQWVRLMLGGGEETSFSSGETKTGRKLDDARITSDFYQMVNWKKLFKSVTIKKMSKVGDEEVYVLVKTPEKGNPITDYISTKSFLILKRDLLISSNTSEEAEPATETYSDHRNIGGLILPFKTVSYSSGTGNTILRLKDVKFDIEIPDSVFKAQPKSRAD